MTKDFFVSYNSADKTWAEWIAWILEEQGKSVVIQAWDFRPGGNFILDMQKAATEAEQTVVVLSDAYLNALYTQPEWAAAFSQDPTSEHRKLLPFRVAPCKPTGMLANVVYEDLVGKTEEEAEQAVVAALKARLKPSSRPGFPGGAFEEERVVSHKVSFPGAETNGQSTASKVRVLWQILLDGELSHSFQDRFVNEIFKKLKTISGDQGLNKLSEKSENYSIILTFKGTEEGFRTTESLFKAGHLTEIDGRQVEQVRLASTNPSSSQQPNTQAAQQPSPAQRVKKNEIKLTPRERLELSRKITGLPVQYFNDLLLLLDPPAGLIPPPSTQQGDRVYALLNWAQSTTGPGLGAVQEALADILPQG